MVVFFNKTNLAFKERTKSNQKTGLDVCLDMISKETGIVHVHIDKPEDASNFLKKNKVKAVIFEALNFPYQFINQLRDSFGFKAYVHLHSKFPFLGCEPVSHKYIREYQKNKIPVIFNHADSFNCFDTSKNILLENIYTSEMKPAKIFDFSKGVINVGCHGSLRHFKNIPIQAISAVKFAKENNLKLNFHINQSRHDGDGSAVITALKSIVRDENKIIYCKYMNHPNFKEYIEKELDLGMQVSISETFNLVSADYISSGVNVVGSDQIDWLSDKSKSSYSDINSIINSMHTCFSSNPTILNHNQYNLIEKNKNSVSQWKQFLEGI